MQVDVPRDAVTGRVKFYNTVKGYGMLVLPDGDALFAREIMLRDGISAAPKGSLMKAGVGINRRRMFVHTIYDVEVPQIPEANWVPATIKWYSPERGYGFVRVRGVSDDAFFDHRDAKFSGIATLDAGLIVQVVVKLDPSRGLRVIKLQGA